MIFFFDAQGNSIRTFPMRVKQGSNNASRTYFLMPTGPGNIVSVAFTLPNGETTPRGVMTPFEDVSVLTGGINGSDGINGVYDKDGNVYYGWFYDLPLAITAYAGTAMAQFYVSTPAVDDNGKVIDGDVIATAGVEFPILKGVAPTNEPPINSYQTLIDYLATINTDYRNFKEKVEYIINEFRGTLSDATTLNLEDGTGVGSVQQKAYKDGDTEIVSTASGQASFAFGKNCVASGTRAVAIGHTCQATGNTAMAIGQVTKAFGAGSLTGGNGTQSDGAYSIVFGQANKNIGMSNAVFGVDNNVNALSRGHIIAGSRNTVEAGDDKLSQTDDTGSAIFGIENTIIISGKDNFNGNGNIVSGRNNTVSASFSAVVGENNQVKALDSIVVGFNNKVLSENTSSTSGKNDYLIVVGKDCEIDKDHTQVFGQGLQSKLSNQMVIGRYNEDKENLLFSVGNGTDDTDRKNVFEIFDSSMTFGKNCIASGTRSIALGNGNTSSGNTAFTIGQVNTNSGNASFVGGYMNNNTTNYTFGFGRRNTIDGEEHIVLGSGNTTGANSVSNIVLGSGNTTNSNKQTLIGNNLNAKQAYALLIGNNLSVEDSGIYIGTYNAKKSVAGKDAVFVVADGSNDSPHNAIEVYKSAVDNSGTKTAGHVKVLYEPTEDDDVVRLTDIKDKLGKVLIGDTYYAITTTTDPSATGTEGYITFILEE